MGYTVLLIENNEVVQVPYSTDLGSFKIMSPRKLMPAHLTITFNYREQLVRVFGKEALMYLDGMSAGASIPKLQEGVNLLGTDRDKNYWANTPGNTGHWLNVMLTWAKEHPKAVWKIE